jgi:UDP-N-acetylglucosamine transferase subunit ALG13
MHDGAASNGDGPRPLVLVSVGTDSYPFDRLVGWVDSWLANGGGGRVHCVVQHGTAQPSQHAVSRDYVDFREMERLIAEAAVVVAHAGPATIRLCADSNKKAIVVPRLREYGEVVDGHQVPFARRLEAEGEIELVESEPALHSTLDRFVAAPPKPDRAPNHDHASCAVVRFEELVSGLFT